jgi:regulator of cell morphogenesis and NO signaling
MNKSADMYDLHNKTLAQIVTGNHKAAGLFEKYHLDYCCKGKRSLQQACEEQDLSMEQVLTDLSLLNNDRNSMSKLYFDKLTLTQLADYIVSTHHEYVKKEMPKISVYLHKVTSKHGRQHPELLKISELFADIQEEMITHMQKEEFILFPRIKELEKVALQQPGQLNLNISYLLSPITIMEQEHDHAGNILEKIRLFTNNFIPPTDACTTYRLSFATLHAFETDLHQHVHLENNILFPRAINLFRKLKTAALSQPGYVFFS